MEHVERCRRWSARDLTRARARATLVAMTFEYVSELTAGLTVAHTEAAASPFFGPGQAVPEGTRRTLRVEETELVLPRPAQRTPTKVRVRFADSENDDVVLVHRLVDVVAGGVAWDLLSDPALQSELEAALGAHVEQLRGAR